MNTSYDIAHILGNNVRILRNQKNLSQLELALRTGRTLAFINKIENGKKWVSPDTLELLCRELNALPYQLFLTADADGLSNEYSARQSHEKTILALREIIAQYEKDEQS